MEIKEIFRGHKKVKCEIRPALPAYHGRSRMGKSTKTVICSFCKNEIEVYIWSFAGCGKKCDCGALLSDWVCYKPLTQEPKHE